MNNYVQLNSLLDSKVGVMIAAICFIVIIFVIGFFLGRHLRMRDFESRLNNKFNQELQNIKGALNKYLEEEGKDIRITKLEGVTAATGEESKVRIIKVKED